MQQRVEADAQSHADSIPNRPCSNRLGLNSHRVGHRSHLRLAFSQGHQPFCTNYIVKRISKTPFYDLSSIDDTLRCRRTDNSQYSMLSCPPQTQSFAFYVSDRTQDSTHTRHTAVDLASTPQVAARRRRSSKYPTAAPLGADAPAEARGAASSAAEMALHATVCLGSSHQRKLQQQRPADHAWLSG